MTQNKKVATLEGHQAPVSALASIKAYFPEISLKPGVSVTSAFVKNRNIKQQNFLVSGCTNQDAQIILWDLQAMKQLRSYQGHSDTITSLVSIRDGHTIISSSLDCSILFWDITDDIPVQNIVEEENSSIYYVHIFNDFSHFCTGGKSGNIFIYKMNYSFNKRYERTVFDSCKKVKTIKTHFPIYVMNESMTRDNLVITAGGEKSISFWNTVSGVETKKVGSHQTDIIGCILVENPLKQKNNSFVLSFGNYDDRILITDSNSGETKEMMLEEDVSVSGGRFTNPNLQFMVKSDAFGRSQMYILGSGLKNGGPCLIKIKVQTEDSEETEEKTD